MGLLQRARVCCLFGGLLLLLGCSNGSGSLQEQPEQQVAPPPSTSGFSIGGSVSGLMGSGLILQLNGARNLSIGSDGAFIFNGLIPDGSAYSVTVATQPTAPDQACSIANGSGTVAGSNIATVAVSCAGLAAGTFRIGGSVNGMAGTGLSLRLNGSEDLPIASNGAFAFATRLPAGTPYEVVIGTKPTNPAQDCTISRGSGTIAGDVANIAIQCAALTYSVGGSVNGLPGSGLVLENNGADPLRIDANGPFTFGRKLADGAAYQVAVRTQPASGTCTIGNGAGTIRGANVANVSVSCNTSDFTIGGTVSGLSGSHLVLRNNGGDNVTIDSNGSFTFPTALPSGASYSVTIAEQPVNPSQQCSVSNGSGTVGNGNVTGIRVECRTVGFKIIVKVSHLQAYGLVLQNNGGDDLAIASNGEHTFPTALPSGASYDVTVSRQPFFPPQECRVEHGSGTVRDKDVKEPKVECRR
jgi:trimeric autotransporter adhesin